MTARIEPGDRRAVGLTTWAFSRVAGRMAGTGRPNLFLTLGRQRRLFRGWLWFAGRLMPGGTLPRKDTEMIILRVAHLRRCAYEFDHHVRLGRRAGLDAGDVERIVAGPDADGWTDRPRALLAAADRLHHDQDLDDGTWATLQKFLTPSQTIELCLLVGHYEMLATVITALRIQPDPPRRA